MPMLRRLMLALGAIEALLLIVCLFWYLADPPGANSSGGAQMGLFFFILLPMIPVSLALILLVFARKSRIALGIAVLIVAAPVLGLVNWGADEIRLRHAEAELRSGRGYFTGPTARALGEAIVARDGPAVTRLAAETDVNMPGGDGTTFLKLALANGQFDIGIVQQLLAAGANPNDDHAWPVRIAIGYRSAPLLALLLQSGADPNIPGFLGNPAFFDAVRSPELIQPLLQGGARITATNDAGRTILLKAINDEYWDAAQTLLDLGADPDAVDREGASARTLLAAVRARLVSYGRPIEPKLLAFEAALQAQPQHLQH